MVTKSTQLKAPRTVNPSPSGDFARMAGHAAEAAALLKALANPVRLLVLCRLVEGEASVGALQPLTGLSLSALSQHLAVLREMALVTTRREGQTIHYAVADTPALAILQVLHDVYCARDSAP